MQNTNGTQFSENPKNGSGGKTSKRVPGIVVGTLLCVLTVIVAATAAFSAAAGATFLYRLYETLPTHSKLQNVEQSLVSKVLDKDGNLIHEFSVERRFWVPFDSIPVELQNAVIAIEDRKFYAHWGIDVQRNVGAVLVNVTRGRKAQGASTITQQLARNVYLTADKSFIRKIREILTATQLERTYTKKEILELYLNQVYLGAGVYGVQAAAQHYFSKNVSELTLNECAVIAGIIQLPERHRPDRQDNTERITARRNSVVRAMVITNAIDKAAADAVIKEPVAANPKVYPPPKAPYFIEMVRRHVSEKFGDDMLYNGGLVIETTLDPKAQAAAEAAMTKMVDSLQRRLNRIFLNGSGADRKRNIPRETFLANFDSLYAVNAEEYGQLFDTLRLRRAQMAVASIDVSTGAIRVLIGGRDFQESRFNRATQARRQAGSVFKSYVYAAALENGVTPATVILDQPITLQENGVEWRPTNYDNTFAGPLSIRNALARSNNLVAIQVFNRIGGQTVVDYAQKLGIKQQLHTGPSLAIGACEVTPMELLTTHAAFSNRGVSVEPFFVRKVTDRNGRVMEENAPKERRVVSPQVAFLMNSMLSTVVCCGTAASVRGLGLTRPAAGKTGTTNEYSDAWFVGYTPQLATVVWAGIDERRSMGYGVTGGMAAVPVWTQTMVALHRDLPVEDFRRPDGIKSLSVCSESFGRATPLCPGSRGEVFLASSEVPSCHIHAARDLREGGIDDLFGPTRRTTVSVPPPGDAGKNKGKGKGEAPPPPPPPPRKRSMMF